jgi:hypothetical protein
MGWFTDTLDALDKPSNALQGWVNDPDFFSLDYAQKGWDHEVNYDFEDAWRDAPQGDRGWDDRTKASLRKGTILDSLADHASYIASIPFNLVLDPVNTLGLGLVTNPYRAVKGMKGGKVAADEAKGMLTTSGPNIIRDFYGPSEASMAKAVAWLASRGLSREAVENTKGVSVGQFDDLVEEVAGKIESPGEFVKWGKQFGLNAAKTSLSPSRRALYRETGINKAMLESPFQAPLIKGKPKWSPEVELIHRTFANRHIGEQAGRVGNTKELDSLLNKGFHSGYVNNKPGVYKELSESFIKGTDNKAVTNQDFKDIEKHFSVWKDGSGIKFGKGPNDKIIIKKAESSLSGRHFHDWQRESFLGDIGSAMAVNKLVPTDPAGLLSYLKNQGVKLPANAKATSDGIIFSKGKTGSSITEGGVNVWYKLKPNGDLVGMVSDEHNLIEKAISKVEKIPGVGKVLPNRVLAITPPFSTNIRKLRHKQSGATKGKKGKGNPTDWDTLGPKGKRTAHLVNPRTPSKEYLELEKKVLGAKALGTGLLGANVFSSPE